MSVVNFNAYAPLHNVVSDAHKISEEPMDRPPSRFQLMRPERGRPSSLAPSRRTETLCVHPFHLVLGIHLLLFILGPQRG
jgi:hypothetical protein